uniref:Uncharacterized protein n=1 Tax=Antheraea pernyi nuclear polyhedrosis virus TaxID=161494 RepID=A0A2Z6C6C9_NPVAP|nr:hypothetical protein [Antheraea pernyi nucleopolyhedrovirus]
MFTNPFVLRNSELTRVELTNKVYQPFPLQDQASWAVKKYRINYGHLPVILCNVIADAKHPSFDDFDSFLCPFCEELILKQYFKAKKTAANNLATANCGLQRFKYFTNPTASCELQRIKNLEQKNSIRISLCTSPVPASASFTINVGNTLIKQMCNINYKFNNKN